MEFGTVFASILPTRLRSKTDQPVEAARSGGYQNPSGGKVMKQGSLRLVLESVNPSDKDFKVAQEIKGIMFASDLDSLHRFDEQRMRQSQRWSVSLDSGIAAGL